MCKCIQIAVIHKKQFASVQRKCVIASVNSVNKDSFEHDFVYCCVLRNRVKLVSFEQKKARLRHAFCILIQFFLLLNDAVGECLCTSRHFECVNPCCEVLYTDLSEFVVESTFLGNEHYSTAHVEQLDLIDDQT